ncbi:MAG TPA: hypothetical protein VMI09_11220 [Candidatus Binataceae bacterium]|nr:hypothetical protein [Candidatus Binataceae bacterium]
MDHTTLEIDSSKATIVSVMSGTAAYDVSVVADEPRIYTALTERPADFDGYFAPASLQHVEAVVTYRALTGRPADFDGVFVPPRRKCIEGVATYTALKKRPDPRLGDIAA